MANKGLTIKGLSLIEYGDGRWLTFRTSEGGCAVLHIENEFSQARLVHSIIRDWAKEQTEIPNE